MFHYRGMTTDCEGFHRRDLLRLGASGLLGLGLADLLRLEAKAVAPGVKARGVIMIWLAGGPATIDMWDPKPEAPEEIRGEFRAIDTVVPGLRVCEHLPGLAGVADRLTLVRSLQHTIAAHGPGTEYLTTGNRPSAAAEYPSLGSLAARLMTGRSGLPASVLFQGLRDGLTAGAGDLGPAFEPFEIEGDAATGAFRARGVSLPEGFTLEELEDRDALRRRFDRGLAELEGSGLTASLDEFQARALDLLHSGAMVRALDLEVEPRRVRDRYGDSPIGRGALAARRLIEAGARFVTLSLGGWDTHAGNFDQLRLRLLPRLDAALSTLLADLAERGLLEETIVYCAGEFGRTPRVNGSAGRDHWPQAMSALLAGGPLRRGHVHGATDPRGMAPVEAPCSPDDVAATIFLALGIDPATEIVTQSGRPRAIFREGRSLDALLS